MHLTPSNIAGRQPNIPPPLVAVVQIERKQIFLNCFQPAQGHAVIRVCGITGKGAKFMPSSHYSISAP